MTILHAHSKPQFTNRLRSVLAEANGDPHSVDIASGYFDRSEFAQSCLLLSGVVSEKRQNQGQMPYNLRSCAYHEDLGRGKAVGSSAPVR